MPDCMVCGVASSDKNLVLLTYDKHVQQQVHIAA